MNKHLLIGIDLGGTNLKIGLLDYRCRIQCRRILNTKNLGGKKGLIKAITEAVGAILEDNRLHKKDIAGIGLGLPGPIDISRGLVHFFPNISGFRQVKLKKILQDALKIKIYLDNDANLMALAEHCLGAAAGWRNVLCITLGTGVGGGLVLDGKLYRGSCFAAGEIGHVPINENGPRCSCGAIACLEAYVGNERILDKAAGLFRRNISLEELSALAAKGNRNARQVWTEAGKHLGIALAGVVNLLNLDGIVIGGGVANAGGALFDSIRHTINARAMGVQAAKVKVVKARLGSDAGMIGAAILVKQNLAAKNK